jgi:CRP-like cAMP-binding protein
MNIHSVPGPGTLPSFLPVGPAEASSAPQVLQPFARIKRWPRDQDIVCEGDAADDWYCVVSGACRQCLVQEDGRRRIVDILLPGDFFGFTVGGRHRFDVQAIAADTIVASYYRREIEALADTDPRVARAIRERAFSTIGRLQEHVLVVGTMTASEKVRAFLNYIFERLPSRNSHMILPVSRYDIADQLGISVETVSRAMTELKASGAINLGSPRNVELIDSRASEEP